MAQPQAPEHFQLQEQPHLGQPLQHQILDSDKLYHYSSSLDQKGRVMWSSFTFSTDKVRKLMAFCADLQKINNLTSAEGLQRFNQTRARENRLPKTFVIQVQSGHCQGENTKFIRCQHIPEHGNPNHVEFHYQHNASTKKIGNQMAKNAVVVYKANSKKTRHTILLAFFILTIVVFFISPGSLAFFRMTSMMHPLKFIILSPNPMHNNKFIVFPK